MTHSNGCLLRAMLILLCYSCCLVAQSRLILCDPMNHSTPGFPVHHQLLEHAQTHVHQVGDAIQPSRPVTPSPPPFNLSQHQGLFQWVSSLHQVAKVLKLQLHDAHPMNIQGWFFFRIDSSPYSPRNSQEASPTPEFESINSSVLSLLMVQLSHPYLTTGKTIALMRHTFVGQVISLLCNMLSRLVIAFFPRSKRLLISWLQSPSAMILEPRKINK